MGHKFVVSVGASSNVRDVGAVLCRVWLAVIKCRYGKGIVGVQGANSAYV